MERKTLRRRIDVAAAAAVLIVVFCAQAWAQARVVSSFIVSVPVQNADGETVTQYYLHETIVSEDKNGKKRYHSRSYRISIKKVLRLVKERGKGIMEGSRNARIVKENGKTYLVRDLYNCSKRRIPKKTVVVHPRDAYKSLDAGSTQGGATRPRAAPSPVPSGESSHPIDCTNCTPTLPLQGGVAPICTNTRATKPRGTRGRTKNPRAVQDESELKRERNNSRCGK